MIISRYLMKELLQTVLAVTFVLLLIFLSNQLVRYVGYTASGKIPMTMLFQIMGLEIPYLLGLLVPLGLYLGIIFTYSRLYADNELRVMLAYGLSPNRLMMLTMLIGLVFVFIVAGLVLWMNPLIAAEKNKLMEQRLDVDNVLNTLVPGRFQVSGDDKRVIYVERISRNHKKAHNIFIAEQKNRPDTSEHAWTVLSAAEGYQTHDMKTGDRFVVATDGFRYEGVPGQNDYKMIQFKKYAIRLQDITIHLGRSEEEIRPITALWHDYDNPKSAAELQWRLSLPLSVFFLSILAVPLSYMRPRQGRYVALFPAILIYVIYVNLLFVARDWVEEKQLSIMLGMWWVHGLLAILGIILFLRQAGLPFFLRVKK